MGGLDTLADLLRKVEDGSGVAETRRSLAFWLHFDGHFELALAALDQLLVDAPDDADAKALRGHVLVHLYRPREAIDAMRALVRDAPDHLMAWQTLAWASREVKYTEAAQEAEARAQAIQRAARTATAGR
jgi:predicted Zn-dependent protease